MELTTKQIISSLLRYGHTVKYDGMEIDMIDELERNGVVIRYVGDDGWHDFIEGDIELRIGSSSPPTATEPPFPPGDPINTPSIPNGWEIAWRKGVGSTYVNVPPVDMRDTTTESKPTVVSPGQFWAIVLAAVANGDVIEVHMTRDDSWMDISVILASGDISYDTSSESPNLFIGYGEGHLDIISLFPGRLFRVDGVVYKIGEETATPREITTDEAWDMLKGGDRVTKYYGKEIYYYTLDLPSGCVNAHWNNGNRLLAPGDEIEVDGERYVIVEEEEDSGTVYVTPLQFCEKLYELLSPETPKLSVYSPDGEYKDVLHWYHISYDRDFKSGVHQMWVGAGDSIRLTPGTRFRYKDQEYLITEDDYDDYPDRIKEGWLSPAGLKVTDEPKTANPQHSISVSDFVKMVADSVSEGVSDITRLSGQTSKTAKVSWATSAVKGTFATQNTIYVVADADSCTEKWLVEPGDEYAFKGKTYVIEEGKEEVPEYISQQFIDAALEAETHYDPGPRWQNAVEMPAMDQDQLEALLIPLELPVDMWVKDTGEWDNYALTAVAEIGESIHLNLEENCNGFWWEVEPGDEFVFNGIHVKIAE